MRKFDDPIFHDEEAARKHFEALRWPDGPICPHCGVVDDATALKPKTKATRPGVYKCKSCQKPFSATVGTVFERSHVPLHKWLYANHLMCSSKKGMSAHQLHRLLGVTYKTAWFMAHRIREAMTPIITEPMGGEGQPVQADETYFRVRKPRAGSNRRVVKGDEGHNKPIVGLVSGGKSRMFRVDHANVATIEQILVRNTDPKAELHTDESLLYKDIGKDFAAHKTVKHTENEYMKDGAHTNAIEGFFSIFKRGMTGVYQHCSEKHLQRYLNEFDFRYNHRAGLEIDDTMRADAAIRGVGNKRLTYRRTNGAA
ncbi:IS1595 family transposase [Dongia sp.]|uniref:IS1595 family transposase n=1 Tax=Dongia sp. TaxID=1977262 RepID=UPI00375147BB